MRTLALIVMAAAVLVGCKSVPEVPVAPKEVYLTVREYIPVPAELTRACDVYKVKEHTYGEAIAAANKRLASLKECNARLHKIRCLADPDSCED